MAQHISIKNSELKGLQKVYKSICKKVERGLWMVSGSLKFEELPYKEHKINQNDRVFVTHRVANGNREMFELHYDAKVQKLLDVFLVS